MRWVTLKVIIVSLAVMGVYTLFANSIPQIESWPPEEINLTDVDLSGEEMAGVGERIFYEKGTCAICHSIGSTGVRAPDLQGVGKRAAGMRPDMSGVEYLIESLIDPGLFIVEGYGNIMPAVHKAPILLNESELMVLVAFLQSLGGVVTVTREDIPAEAREAGGEAAPSAVAGAVVPGEAEKGAQSFQVKCLACHIINGVGGPLGPDLSDISARKDESYIRESILNPASVIAEGYPPAMPPIFDQQLTIKEFNDIVAYLMTLKGD
jgi:mono/diheme cytochrome c family protein